MAKRPAPITVATEIVVQDASEAFETARNKAMRGHKTWLVYQRRDGSYALRLYTAEAIKAAMLAVGTQGRFWWISANSGVSSICRSWSYALHLLKCARGWERHGYSAA